MRVNSRTSELYAITKRNVKYRGENGSFHHSCWSLMNCSVQAMSYYECLFCLFSVPVLNDFEKELADLMEETDLEQFAGKTPVAIVVLHDGTELHFFQFTDPSENNRLMTAAIPRYY